MGKLGKSSGGASRSRRRSGHFVDAFGQVVPDHPLTLFAASAGQVPQSPANNKPAQPANLGSLPLWECSQ